MDVKTKEWKEGVSFFDSILLLKMYFKKHDMER